MNIAPIAGLLGAAVATMSVFKWIVVGLVVVGVLWALSSSSAAKNALDSRAINNLVKSAAQWNARALQDTNPVIGLMNANYAVAYLNVARSLGSDSDVEKKGRVSVDQMSKELEATQSKFMHSLTDACPSIVPAGHAATGWPVKLKR